MSDTVFRKKIEEVEKPEERTEEVEKETEKRDRGVPTTEPIRKNGLSPLLFRQQFEKPFLSKLLGVEEVYDRLPVDLKENIDFVEEYFIELVKKGQKGNDEVSYKELIKYLENITNTKFATLTDKIAKIADFIKTIKRAKEYGKS